MRSGSQHSASLVVLLGVAAWVGCGASRSDNAQHLSPDILSAALAAEPAPVRARFNTSLAEKRRYVDALLRERVLYAEAQRRGLDKDPLLQRRFRQLVIARLEERLRDEIKPESISDEEVAGRYEKERATLGRPAMTRVSRIVVATRTEAEQLRSEIAVAKDPIARFRALASSRSLDPAARATGGDLGFVYAKSGHLPPEAAAAAVRLANVGDLSVPLSSGGPSGAARSNPVRTRADLPRPTDQWMLVIKTGELPAAGPSEEQARESIRARLLAERRGHAVETVLERLRAESSAGISDETLARIVAPAGEAAASAAR